MKGDKIKLLIIKRAGIRITSALYLLFVLLFTLVVRGQRKILPKKHIPLDSIRLSDPFILADSVTQMYYMTGTGGLLWKSKDLHYWDGPFVVARPDISSWMGTHPMIWAAEIHYYKGRYFYFATFTNRHKIIGYYNGNALERRASHILVSDHPDGPFVPMADSIYLPGNLSTLDATFWVDQRAIPWMIYCKEWVQNNNGTVDKIQLKPDLSGTIGKSTTLFRASASPWSREKVKGQIKPNKVTDGPYVFRTQTGRLGMIWTSWIYDVYTQGVAYSKSGTLAGPWVQDKKPITPPNYGHGMIFKTFEGQTLMALHSHKDLHGHYLRIPHLFIVDLTGNKLVVKQPYQFKEQ